MLASLTAAEKAALYYRWSFWARPEQLPPPGEWLFWLVLAGRGFGKTRIGAEWIRSLTEGPSPLIAPPGAPKRIALVAETAPDARDVMVDGESGLLSVFRPEHRPRYTPSKRRVTWQSGIRATTFSAEEPDQLRGPQHGAAWCDELAKWRYAQATWDQLLFGMRLGKQPRVCITTTPRPLKVLKEIKNDPLTSVTVGTTYENLAHLSPVYQSIIRKFEGTRLGRQELEAHILEDIPGALWTYGNLDKYRRETAPELKRIVVAIDPPVTSGEDADECGIIVAGVDEKGHGHVIADRSCQGYTPQEWAKRAVMAYHEFEGDRIVAEVNQGGEMVETIIRQVDASVSYRAVRASRGKVTRAEPVSALYEQGRIHHVGSHAELEDQMCEFTTDFDKGAMGYSPDRVDALVWAMTDLMLDAAPVPRIRSL